MKRNSRYYEISKARIYRNAYRPSANIGLFLKSLLSIILIGQSPIGNGPDYTKIK
jgi:hypothetical protein